MPDGTRLEAHSGLGDRLDDPRYVDEQARGATPPHLYELTLREDSFHGVQALRLTPIGEGGVYGRAGLLAHPYMLGPNGDSNGCVSVKDYDAFLRAYENGQIKRLMVVASANQVVATAEGGVERPRQVGRIAGLDDMRLSRVAGEDRLAYRHDRIGIGSGFIQ
jgi:hypothetical protein